MKDWIIRPYREGDDQGILDCLIAAFGRWPAVDIDVPPIDHLRWKQAGAPSDLQRVVADGSMIVGGRLLIAQRFLFHGRALESCNFVDLMVHPSHQTRGVMRTIWEENLALGTRVYGMSIGLAAHPDVQRYMRKTGMNPPANSIEVLDLDVTAKPPIGPHGVTIRRTFRFEANWEPLLSQGSQPFDFILERTADYLNWRYADRRAGRFRILVAGEKHHPLGYLVPAIARGKGFIADLLVLPDRLDVLLALLSSARELARAERASPLRCWSPRHHLYRDTLIRAGFRATRPVDGLYFMPFGDTTLDGLFDQERLSIHVCVGDTDLV